MGETRVRRECRTLVLDEPKGVVVRLEMGTGLQHWASTLGFNPGPHTGPHTGLQVRTEGASSRLIALAISRIWSTSPLN